MKTSRAMRFPAAVYPISVSAKWAQPALTTSTAEEILKNRFGFFGEFHDLPDPVDWDAVIGTGHWPHDLNRFKFLNTLLETYETTGNAVYARKGLDLIFSWIDQCTPLRPEESKVAWNSYLNIALHIENWLLFLAGVDQKNASFISDLEFERLRESIRFQIRFLDSVIPTQSNNWVIIGTCGVLVGLAFFPDLPEANEWSERAWLRMTDSLTAQILPDGVHDEMTPHYHFTVVNRVLRSLIFAELTPVPPPEELRRLVASTLHYLRQTLTPDGYQVAFNNSDPDFAGPVVEMLESPLVKSLMGDLAPLESECFPWGGTTIMREGSYQGRDECYLAFDAGSFGVNHQHEDKLSFWLSAFGRSFLVDPGRHLYDYSPVSLYPFLRTTAAHSTIMIDGNGQNARAAWEIPGAWRPIEPQPVVWEKLENGGCVAGAFYNLKYGEAQIAATHYRIILFHPDLKAWTVVDSVEGEGEHLIESRFQFCPSTLKIDGCRIQTTFFDANLLVQVRAEDWPGGMRIICGERNPDGGWFSPGVNRIEPAPCLVLSTEKTKLPWTAVTVLVPFREPDSTSSNAADECIRRGTKLFTPVLDRLQKMEALSCKAP